MINAIPAIHGMQPMSRLPSVLLVDDDPVLSDAVSRWLYLSDAGK